MNEVNKTNVRQWSGPFSKDPFHCANRVKVPKEHYWFVVATICLRVKGANQNSYKETPNQPRRRLIRVTNHQTTSIWSSISCHRFIPETSPEVERCTSRLGQQYSSILVFTAHISSCAKVMFSQACVKNSIYGGCIPECNGQGGVYLSMQWVGGCLPAGCTSLDPEADTPHHPEADIPLWRWPLKRAVRILLECILVWWIQFIGRSNVFLFTKWSMNDGKKRRRTTFPSTDKQWIHEISEV